MVAAAADTLRAAAAHNLMVAAAADTLRAAADNLQVGADNLQAVADNLRAVADNLQAVADNRMAAAAAASIPAAVAYTLAARQAVGTLDQNRASRMYWDLLRLGYPGCIRSTCCQPYLISVVFKICGQLA
jgi:hypothetical protein